MDTRTVTGVCTGRSRDVVWVYMGSCRDGTRGGGHLGIEGLAVFDPSKHIGLGNGSDFLACYGHRTWL